MIVDNVDNFVDKLGLDHHLGGHKGKMRVKVARYRGDIKKQRVDNMYIMWGYVGKEREM